MPELPEVEFAKRLLTRAIKGATIADVKVLDPRADIAPWRELGPDPLADGIDPRVLFDTLHARRRTIKEALLDQTVLAGIGNILAIEALWRARIHPRSRTNALSPAHVRALSRA